MYDFEKVDNAVKFVNFLEKNGLETLLNTIELFHSNYSDRKEYQVAFNIILLYYKDVLNYLIDSDIILFKDYIDKINVIATKNNIDMILKKIEYKIYLLFSDNTKKICSYYNLKIVAILIWNL